MTHQQIEANEIVERYVLHQLPPEERRAFQEHYFSCDECFERTQTQARFIASAREAADSGFLVAGQSEPASSVFLFPALLRAWVVPALAAGLLVAFALIGLWALSLRRQNQQLVQQTAERSPAAEELRRSETRIRELEASGTASQEQLESLKKENSKLKEQLQAAERERETHVSQLRRSDINVPVINIFPVDEAQRGGGASAANRIRVPLGTESLVLILGDYKAGYASYRLEIRDASGRLVTRHAGLKPDQNGDLSVMLSRALLRQSKYKLSLFGRQELIAQYVIEIE
ncbi:MAG TPA: zf-HC2 domain-containing protein [Pyrinomonadaceae bacterium]